jgi:hypothetical protein
MSTLELPLTHLVYNTYLAVYGSSNMTLLCSDSHLGDGDVEWCTMAQVGITLVKYSTGCGDYGSQQWRQN